MNNQAELISIGNELLSGRTVNMHAQTLGAALTRIGLRLMRDTTIPDEIPIIQSAVSDALDRTDLVFVSGGLGSTVDDITRNALAKLLNRELVLDTETVTTITERYTARGRSMTPAAGRQGLVLSGAVVLPNPVGAAPGERLDLPNDKFLFILPGPPKEFQAILEENIIPWLSERYDHLQPRPERVFRTRNIAESDIVTLLENADFQPRNISLGFYPAQGKVEIRMSSDPEHEDELNEAEQTVRCLLHKFLDNES